MGKRALLSEADAAQILRRYGAMTVIGLLREVAKFDGAKVDWNLLVQKSKTGISNAREYQALWRHIAYRAELADHYEDDDPLLDDDSDLEFELLPSPAVSSEANADVVRWVKADMQQFGIRTRKRVQGKPKAKEPKTAKEPRTISIQAHLSSGLAGNTSNGTPRKKSSGGSGKARNKTPVKSAMPPCVTSLEFNAASPPVTKVGEGVPEAPETTPSTAAQGSERKKRKFWTPEEDQELMSAVEKFGEGNWTNILKGFFTHERTAAQLSQRWHLIRKRREQAAAASRLLAGAGEGNAVQSTAAEPSLPSNPASDKNGAGHPNSSPPAPVANGNGNEAALPTPTPAEAVEPLPSPVSQAAAVNTGSSPSESKAVDNAFAHASTAAPSGPLDTSSLNEENSHPAAGEAPTLGESPSRQEQAQAGASVIAAAASVEGMPESSATAAAAAPVLAVSQDPITGDKNANANVGGVGPVVAPAPSSASASGSASSSSQAVAAAKSSPIGPAAGASPAKNITRSNSGGAGSRGMPAKQPSIGPDPGVQAAAVAAGARIAPPSAAASLLKAAQSGNVVHIGSDGLPVTKSSPAGAGNGASSTGGAIVHYFCTGASAAAAASTQQQQQQGVTTQQNGQRPAQQTKTQLGKGVMAATSQIGSPATNASATSPPASAE